MIFYPHKVDIYLFFFFLHPPERKHNVSHMFKYVSKDQVKTTLTKFGTCFVPASKTD